MLGISLLSGIQCMFGWFLAFCLVVSLIYGQFFLFILGLFEQYFYFLIVYKIPCVSMQLINSLLDAICENTCLNIHGCIHFNIYRVLRSY